MWNRIKAALLVAAMGAMSYLRKPDVKKIPGQRYWFPSAPGRSGVLVARRAARRRRNQRRAKRANMKRGHA